jgi:hypothetical protein
MTLTPQRIQRRRLKGWRAPEGAKYVGRGTAFGNPYGVRPMPGDTWGVSYFTRTGEPSPNGLTRVPCAYRWTAHSHATNYYRDWLRAHPELVAQARRELAGRDLLCWCPVDFDCHADVLLAVARGEEP